MAVPTRALQKHWDISVQDILAIAGQGPYRHIPMTEQPVPMRPDGGKEMRVRVTPIFGEPFEGVVVLDRETYYVVASDRNPSRREAWFKNVCELLPE